MQIPKVNGSRVRTPWGPRGCLIVVFPSVLMSALGELAPGGCDQKDGMAGQPDSNVRSLPVTLRAIRLVQTCGGDSGLYQCPWEELFSQLLCLGIDKDISEDRHRALRCWPPWVCSETAPRAAGEQPE